MSTLGARPSTSSATSCPVTPPSVQNDVLVDNAYAICRAAPTADHRQRVGHRRPEAEPVLLLRRAPIPGIISHVALSISV